MRRVGLQLVKGYQAKNRLMLASRKSLRYVKTNSDTNVLDPKSNTFIEQSDMVDMLQSKVRRHSSKFSVTTEEGKKLVQEHKLQIARKSVFLLQALDMTKENEGRNAPNDS